MTTNHRLGMYISVSLGRIHTESKSASDGCMDVFFFVILFCFVFCRGEERKVKKGGFAGGKMEKREIKGRSCD